MSVLKERIPDSAYYTWFSKLKVTDIQECGITLGTPNNFVMDFVIHHYQSTIQNVASSLAGHQVAISFINLDTSSSSVYDDPYTPPPQAAIPEYPLISQVGTKIDSTLALNPAYNFDNFVVGDCNQMAHAACKAVSESPNQNNFNPLVIYGGTGMGKTHLLQAIAHFIMDAETARKVVYRTSEEFTREYIEFVHKSKDSRSFYRVYQDTDVLIIDDIQFLADKNSTQEEFFNIFNNLHQLNKLIVITSDRLPSEIKGLHEHLLSRFNTGLLANLSPPKLETRLAILKKKQESDSIPFINDEVLSYVADSVRTNVRELEGTLIKLTAYANFTDMPITVDIAKQILGDTVRNQNKPITLKKILQFVSADFNVPINHLISQSRKKNVAEPRQVAMYLARQMTDNSLHTIGLQFGRDYSTVIHSLKKVETLLQSDSNLKQRTQRLKDSIQQSAG